MTKYSALRALKQIGRLTDCVSAYVWYAYYNFRDPAVGCVHSRRMGTTADPIGSFPGVMTSPLQPVQGLRRESVVRKPRVSIRLSDARAGGRALDSSPCSLTTSYWPSTSYSCAPARLLRSIPQLAGRFCRAISSSFVQASARTGKPASCSSPRCATTGACAASSYVPIAAVPERRGSPTPVPNSRVSAPARIRRRPAPCVASVTSRHARGASSGISRHKRISRKLKDSRPANWNFGGIYLISVIGTKFRHKYYVNSSWLAAQALQNVRIRPPPPIEKYSKQSLTFQGERLCSSVDIGVRRRSNEFFVVSFNSKPSSPPNQ